MLTYAALVWWKRTHLLLKKQIGHIQRITCLGMTGCMRTTPTVTIGTLPGLSSLQLLVEKEARQAAYRLYCFNHFKKSDWRHSYIFKMATEDFPVLMAPSDSILPLEVFLSREIWLSQTEAWLPFDGMKFYTDGSMFEGRAGSGVFFGGNLISRLFHS
jgi:hypothetical protein